MFHVKYFGTIGGAKDYTFARREKCLFGGIFYPVRREEFAAPTRQVERNMALACCKNSPLRRNLFEQAFSERTGGTLI
jgi:hypothetical protein